MQLTGEEIPIDDGLVKWDSRGGKGDLPVKKGETVLILRMEGNPSGKWLVKNEKGKSKLNFQKLYFTYKIFHF